ncbi:hydrogenase nickel incorporation protein HypB [bacterium]|nr:hydrogenase nickel incorporation protein HypB [bacterium]
MNNVITVERKVLEKNDAIAMRLRQTWSSQNIFAANFVSSPGSGKTSLLEATIPRLKNILPMAVIEGDVQTDLDARRIHALDVPVVQIVTNGACHLEAQLVDDAFMRLHEKNIRLLMIENVGNLVCPSSYDLGENMKIVIVSVTEGDDKPLKYPAMFVKASVLIINKIDLLPYVQSDLTTLRGNALSVNPSLRVFEMSCTTGKGVDEWCAWLCSQVKD